MKNKLVLLLSVVLLALFVSCATATSDGAQIGEHNVKQSIVHNDDPKAAAAQVVNSKEKYADDLVFALDAGFTTFYAKDYEAASSYLAQAEALIQDRYTKSISQDISSYVVNDLQKDYPGELYEDVAVNIFSALAYYNNGNLDDAMVEIRRVNNKLVDFELNIKKQEKGLVDVLLAFTPNPFQDLPSGLGTTSYHYSPLATYLSMVFYNMKGDSSNAKVDYSSLKDHQYYVSEEDYNIPAGSGRLNIVSFEGLIAAKEEEAKMSSLVGLKGINFSLLKKTVSHKVVWPRIKGNADNTAVQSATVYVDGKQATTLSMIESFTQDAKDSLDMTVRTTYLKSYYRGLTKMTAAYAASEAALRAAKDKIGSISASGIAGAIAKKAAEVAFNKVEDSVYASLNAINDTEVADTRMGNYLPSQASVGGVTLSPGSHEVRIVYSLKNGRTIEDVQTVEIVAGKNTILVSTCAK